MQGLDGELTTMEEVAPPAIVKALPAIVSVLLPSVVRTLRNHMHATAFPVQSVQRLARFSFDFEH